MVSGDDCQSVKPGFVIAQRLEPASRHWRAMTANSEATLETYKASSKATRTETRHILDAALREVQPQSLERQLSPI